MSPRAAGLAAAFGLAALALVLARAVPVEIPAVTLAVLLGLALGNARPLPAPLAPGLDWAARHLLPAAIVLVGLRLSFRDVAGLGAGAFALALLAVAAGLAATLALGRLLGVRGTLATLIAVGTAICGNTAIAAAAPLLRARRSEVAYAVGTITAFGTLAVIALPFAARAAGMDETTFGLWAGGGIHDTSQVLAAAFAHSTEAGETATVVKLARNALLGPVLIALALLAGAGAGERRGGPALGLPWFVWAFVAAVALASVGAIPGGVADVAGDAALVLVAAAIAAVGATTSVAAMRAAGARPLLLGLLAATAVSGAVLGAIPALGLG